MDEWLRDFRYGARMLAKRPGTSAIAIIALALGIGLTTTMFSIVEGVILRGLPFDRSDRIMFVGRATVQNPSQTGGAPLHDFLDWRARQTSFEQLAGVSNTNVTITDDGGWPERVRAARLTTDMLSLLRVKPILGRDFTEADAVPGAPAVCLIGYSTWVTRFQSDPNVFGRPVRLDGAPATVIGVMPEKFGFPESQQLWMPQSLALAVKRGDGTRVNVIGRLRDGVTPARAHTEMAGIAKQLADAYVENKDTVASVTPYLDRFVPERIRTTFYAMLGAVLGVMLIACVNVTNLQLARAAERSKEFALRVALGSGRWRIVRQSLAEGLVLSIVGAILGLGLAEFGVRYFMRAIADTQPPFWIDVRLDPTVLAFVTAITMAAALVSSVVPGLRVARTDVNAAVKDDSRGTTSLRMGRFGRWLVIVEVTVSCVLLVVSGLMIRSILATSRLDYPFATRDVFFATLNLEEREFRQSADQLRAIERLEDSLARLPGVRRAALSTSTPAPNFVQTVEVEGVTPVKGQERQSRFLAATPGFFEVLDVAPVQGRVFNATDRPDSLRVAVVDQAFVESHLSGGPAIGRRIRFPRGEGAEPAPWLSVVGIVPTLATAQPPNQTAAGAYVPLVQSAQRGLTILARTTGDPVALTPAVRAAVKAVNDQTPVANAGSLDGEFWRRGWAFRLFGGLFLLFGAAALLLAAAGLYGVMAFTVRRRTQEIGVRMALGASRRGVLGMVLWQGLWRVALAIAIGLWPGWLLARQMRALLSNVSTSDPVVFVGTAVTLLVAGGLATLAPALRASSVDPLTALRHD
jgi:predicted permease